MLAQAVQYGPPQQGPGFTGGTPWVGHPMMWWVGNNPNTFWLFGILWFISWIALIAALVALTRWLWKKGDRGR